MLNLNLNSTYISRGPVGPSPTPVPVVDFSASTTGPTAGDSVTFTDLSTNTPTSWQWEFPGGTPTGSTSQNPTVTYSATGSYNVSLSAGNTGGTGSLTKTNYITVTAPACASPLISTTNLEAYYKFDGNVNDSSGNGRTGTEYGSPTYVAGKFGQAVDLDGSTQYVSIPNYQYLQPQTAGTSWSMSTWIKYDVVGVHSIFDTFTYAPPYQGVRFRVNHSPTSILVSVGADNLSFTKPTSSAGTWYHFAATMSANTVKLYWDGTLLGTLTWSSPETVYRAGVAPEIGRAPNGTSYLNGQIDDYSIWRRALSGTDVATLASNCPLTS